MPIAEKKLVILAGPTGVGKTDASIAIAKHFGTEIISCDSRQFFRELSIGTAVPSQEQLKTVRHHLIGNKSIHDYYNAYLFEQDALQILEQLFMKHNVALMVGGSGMYSDVIENGIDDLPDIDEQIRHDVGQLYKEQGLAGLRNELKTHDPEFYSRTDLKNYKRIIRAVEVCWQTGNPYSSFRRKEKAKRKFSIHTYCLTRNREELYQRINRRVEQMVEQGLVDEARQFYHLRELNALNTVGYKELFDYFDGRYPLEKAIELIQRNTRHYAKKQLSWYRRNPSIQYLHPNEAGKLIDIIKGTTQNL